LGGGSYLWTVPTTLAYGIDYQIRVTSSTDPEYTDTSDGYFTIGTNVCSASPLASLSSIVIITDSCTPPPPSPMLDLVIMSDTTGSMGGDIAQVKASANEIVQALDSKGLDYRVAIADYRDYPVWPYGGAEDYVYNLDLPFSNNKAFIINSINGLSLGWGADEPESVYSALVNAMEDPAKDPANSVNFGWRNGATKVIIIMGDAPPHIPEPWAGGHSLTDVTSTSASIDPVMVFSIAIGSSESAYNAFSDISSGTGGKVYTSPDASGIVSAIVEAIGDISPAPESYGVLVNITPSINETTAGNSSGYSVNVTNIGSVNDAYNISLELNNFAGFQRAYPVAIQPSWVIFNNKPVTLDPGMSEVRSLTVTAPENWAGMNNTIYIFNITATSTTNESITNTTPAELKVKADKRSMAEYSKLEIQWLRKLIQGSTIDNGIKNALFAKLANAESKVDTAIINIDSEMKANENLNTAQNVLTAFSNQVEAQYDKKIMQPDAVQLEERASQIVADLETTKNN